MGEDIYLILEVFLFALLHLGEGEGRGGVTALQYNIVKISSKLCITTKNKPGTRGQALNGIHKHYADR